MPRGTFHDCCCQCPHPHGEPLLTHTFTREPPTLEGRSGSVSCGVTAAFPWILVCLPRVESLFPPLLWRSCNQILLAFKVRFPGDPSPFARSPCWKAWYGAQNIRENGRTSLVFLFSTLWAAHLASMEFDFIGVVPLLLSCYSSTLSLDVGNLFLVSSHILLLMVVQQLNAVSLLSQVEVCACPSPQPSWTSLLELSFHPFLCPCLIFLAIVMQCCKELDMTKQAIARKDIFFLLICIWNIIYLNDWNRLHHVIKKKIPFKFVGNMWKESESEVAQPCLTLCDSMDCSLSDSSVHGIFQARVLEWIAISFSRGSSWPRTRAQVSRIAGRSFTVWAIREAHSEL